VSVDLALGKDRQDVVEFLDLLDLNALDHRPLRSQFGLPAFEVGDVNRIRLTDKAVDCSGGIQILHCHFKAEIFRGLIADRLDHRIGHADMSQFDVFDLLRPDRRKAADDVGSDCGARCSNAGLQNRAP
jgi:hypothetical protein